MYICCLRAIPNWQREAAGSTTDLIAAIMMTQAASDALDPRLSAQMFQLVCKYAIGLDLHNTDSPNYPSRFGRDNVDEARRGFWELMHYEFFHRLVYDDPPTMTAQMKEWIVSLPWLEPCKRTVSQEVPTIKFILKSRLTFILAEFFMLLENVQGHLEHESFAKVLALCQQIDDLYKDWDIVSEHGCGHRMRLTLLGYLESEFNRKQDSFLDAYRFNTRWLRMHAFHAPQGIAYHCRVAAADITTPHGFECF
ncbi:hypothetical protein NW761_014162 [Fusarium oxysporum]|nr:hypothetical protein NW758_003869 [Fusarium oxysporum]KAJ4073566.1 hypothetical protein NW761_014162 [Fusarium oxysporum]